MSSRNFQDRYRNLARLSGNEPEQHHLDNRWPIPAGCQLRQSGLGAYVQSDRVYSGSEIETARSQLLVNSAFPPESHVYLDTETTGLAGGTGTYVFLVGLGRFIEDGLLVRQFFMRHPGEEAGLLSAIEREIENFAQLVTFNGRSFDMPLLESRFRMHHHSLELPREHLDLLHPARAIWKHRLASCSLDSLEQTVLGVSRDLDAPGWLIPSIYFAYLKDRQVQDLDAVLEHNRIDIVSLTRLTGLVLAYHSGTSQPEHEIDRAAIALQRLRTEISTETLAGSRVAWHATSIPAELRFQILRELTTGLKRAGRRAEAVSDWNHALTDPSRRIRFLAAEELAKFLEHDNRDYETALSIARQAADSAHLARDTRIAAAFEHRIQRLQRKAGKRERQ